MAGFNRAEIASEIKALQKEQPNKIVVLSSK